MLLRACAQGACVRVASMRTMWRCFKRRMGLSVLLTGKASPARVLQSLSPNDQVQTISQVSMLVPVKAVPFEQVCCVQRPAVKSAFCCNDKMLLHQCKLCHWSPVAAFKRQLVSNTFDRPACWPLAVCLYLVAESQRVHSTHCSECMNDTQRSFQGCHLL